MLKKRIIPTLLWKNVGLVKGEQFDSWRRVGPVLPAVKVYNLREVDELVVLDIKATEENRDLYYDEIRQFSSECFVPLAIGGGLHSVEQIRDVLSAGADKVVINSAAYEDPELITRARERFGAQCVVVAIDAQKSENGYRCYSHSATRQKDIAPAEWAKKIQDRGAGEILLQSIDRDGTMDGYDLDLVKRVTKTVDIPVIASGGAGDYEDILEVIDDGKASAAAAASIFHFTEQTPLEAKKHLAKHGIPVRKSLHWTKQENTGKS